MNLVRSFTQTKLGWVKFYCGMQFIGLVRIIGILCYIVYALYFMEVRPEVRANFVGAMNRKLDEVLVMLPFAVWGYWTALWLIRKSPNAVRKAKIFLAVSLAVNGVALILVLPYPNLLEFLKDAIRFAYIFAWLAYFHRSRRVKDAYP